MNTSNSLSPRRSPEPNSQPPPPFWQGLLARLMYGLSAVSAIVPVLVMFAVLMVFVYQSYIFSQRIPLFSFLTSARTLVSVKDTLLITAIALLVAIPIGTMAAIYLSEYASPAIRRILKPCLEALADLPTFVYGVFALILLALIPSIFPFFSELGVRDTGVVIGVLIAPIVSFLSEKAIAKVPKSLRQRASDIGLSKRKTIVNVVLRAASPGIVASFAVAASRALGVTMIAVLLSGPGNLFMTDSILRGVRSFIPHVFPLGLVLLLMTVSLTSFGYWLLRHSPRSIRVRPVPNAVATSTPSALHGTTFFRRLCDRGFAILGLSSALLGVVVISLLLIASITHSDNLFGTDLYQLSFFRPRWAEAAMNSAGLLLLTVLFSFPLSIGTALYLEEYAPNKRFKQFLGFTIANLATIPSILYGLVGLVIFVRWLRPWTHEGIVLPAALTLTLVVLPILTIELRAALRAVPRALRQAAYGRGMLRGQIISRIVLPAAFPGILAALLRSLSRIAGEMAPLIVLGVGPFLGGDILFSPLVIGPIIFVNVAAGLLRDRYYHRRSSLLRSR